MIAHNKTLAAQLCNEFREFFPDNAVEYFVSYYDYYQPEAYVPAQDLYIEKDSSINDEIDRLRHAATAALFARRDVIIVASVSCIYGIGSPELYREQMQLFKVGEWIDRDEVLPQAGRDAVPAQRHEPRPRHLPGARRGARDHSLPTPSPPTGSQLFGDEIEAIQHFDPLTGEILDEIDHVSVWPATHYVTKEETIERAVDEIRAELERAHGRVRGATASSSRRTGCASAPQYDMEMMQGARLLLRDRELLADPRRPPAGQPAAHADRLLPRRLRRLRRRVAPDDPADRRHVRGRPLAQADAGRLRLPPAVGDRQPAAQVRRVPRPGRPAGDGLGDAGAVRAGRVDPRSSSRSSARPGSSTPRSRCARRRTRSTT